MIHKCFIRSEDKELDEFDKTFTMADLDVEEKEGEEEEDGGDENSDRKTVVDEETKEEVRVPVNG